MLRLIQQNIIGETQLQVIIFALNMIIGNNDVGNVL